MTTHVIHFAGLINSVTAERLRDITLDALRQGATELRIHFASDGGLNLYGFTLYNFLRSLPVPLTVHNIGNVESMSVVVFLAGAKRIVCPHSRFLIHPLHWGFNAGQVDHARLREYVASLDNDLERYAQIFEERTKGAKSILDIRAALSGREKIVTASEAVALGIAHEAADAAISQGATTWWVSTQ